MDFLSWPDTLTWSIFVQNWFYRNLSTHSINNWANFYTELFCYLSVVETAQGPLVYLWTTHRPNIGKNEIKGFQASSGFWQHASGHLLTYGWA